MFQEEIPLAEESFKRKPTSLLSADIEGYSRVMGEDEDATIRTLFTYRALMSTLIHKHRGRVVDSPGDNLLADRTWLFYWDTKGLRKP